MSGTITVDGSRLQHVAATPETRGIQFGAGGIGRVRDSVNLFRGDVGLPVTLLSLSGPGGLEASLSLLYRSNVQAFVDRSNVHVPTGIAGLGWSFGGERVVRDARGGSVSPDGPYYLITGSGVTRLHKAGEEAGDWLFEAEHYEFWEIRYSRATETWTVVKEDGGRVTYGGPGPEDAPFVEYGVHWGGARGTWTGSSTRTAGQTAFPLAWNAREFSNVWGDRIRYEYESDRVHVGGPEGLRYTRAVRLVRVIDAAGRVVVLRYGDKRHDDGVREYEPPHVNPDDARVVAYQDRFDAKFLEAIDVFAREGGDRLHSVVLEYELANVSLHHKETPDARYYYKRYLTGITGIAPGGRSLPGVRFAYHNTPDDIRPDIHRGALRAVTYPEGGVAAYAYDHARVIPAWEQSCELPVRGTPRVWFGPDYVLVCQHDPSATRPLTLDAYSWNGRWVPAELELDLARAPDVSSLTVATAEDFFAVMFKTAGGAPAQMVLTLFHRRMGRFGVWGGEQWSLDVGDAGLSLAVGERFAAVSSTSGVSLCLVWDERRRRWRDATGDVPVRPNRAYAIAAAGDALAVASFDAAASRCEVELFVLDPDALRLRALTVSDHAIDGVVWLEGSTPSTLWGLGDGFAAVTYVTDVGSRDVAYAVRVYQWDADLHARVAVEVPLTAPRDAGLPFATSHVSGSTIGNLWTVLRYDGLAWRVSALAGAAGVGPDARFAYGSDTGWMTGRRGTVTIAYSPYANDWRPPQEHHAEAADAVAVSGDYVTCGDRLSYIDGEGRIRARGSFVVGAGGRRLDGVVNRGPLFLVYQSDGESTTVVPLRDGDLDAGDVVTFAREKVLAGGAAGPGTDLVGTSAFVTYRGEDLDQATSLTIHRFVPGSMGEDLYGFPVRALEIDDGYQRYATAFRYDRREATLAPTGTVVEYRCATEIPGLIGDPGTAYDDPPAVTPFGKTSYRYFNGNAPLPRALHGGSPLPVPAWYSLLHGMVSEKAEYDAAGELVASTEYGYEVRAAIVPVGTAPRGPVDLVGAYVRQTRERSTRFEVSLEVGSEAASTGEARVPVVTDLVHAYSPSTGLLEETSTESYGSTGMCQRIVEKRCHAWEVPAYAGLMARHLYSPVAARVGLVDGGPTEIEVTTWKDWGGDGTALPAGAWGPAGTYVGRHAGVYDPGRRVPVRFDDWAGRREPPAGDWVRAGKVIARGAGGAETERIDAYARRSAVTYDASGVHAVATFDNAGRTQAFYCGFEDYEPQCGPWWPGGVGPPAGWLVDGDAHTGVRCLELPRGAGRGLAITLTDVDPVVPYVLSCWVKTGPGFPEGAGAPNAGWRVGVDRRDPVRYPIAATAGEWAYQRWVIAPTAGAAERVTVALEAYSEETGEDRYVRLDDVFVAPLVGLASATVYDPRYLDAVAEVDGNGRTSRTFRDAFRRPAAATGPGETVTHVSTVFLTRAGRDAAPYVFPRDEPNATLEAVPQDGGVCADLTCGDRWRRQWTSSTLESAWTVRSGELIHRTGNPDVIAFRATVGWSDYGVRVSVYPERRPERPIGLRIGDALAASWAPGTGWVVTVGGDTVAAPAGGDRPLETEWFLVASRDPRAGDTTVLFYADGRRVCACRTAVPIRGALELFAGDPSVAFRNVVAFGAPRLSAEYTDGAGNLRQRQVLSGTACVIEETCYDRRGEGAVVTKPAARPGALFGYDVGFVESIEWDTGRLRGFVSTAYPGDDGFPYARVESERSPLARAVEGGRPGRAFAIRRDPVTGAENRHVPKASYGTNVRGQFGRDPYPSGQYFVRRVTDADSVSAYSVTDRAGRILALASGPVGRDGTERHVARVVYDDRGNPVRTLTPNALADAAGEPAMDAWTSHREYDFLDRVTAATSADTGTSRFVYDLAGNLRFAADADGLSDDPNVITYQKFDVLGRLVERGIFRAPWDGRLLQAMADAEPGWPDGTQPHTACERRVYDGDGVDPSLAGRLAATWNASVDGDGAVDRTFAYDAHGRVTRVTLSAGAFDGVIRDVRYRYDASGDVVAIRYPDESPVREVRYAYDRHGRPWRIGTPEDPALFAEYEYAADGSIAAVTQGGGDRSAIVTTNVYNPPGWLLSSVASVGRSTPVMHQSLSYTSGGSRAEGCPAGYHTGALASVAFERLVGAGSRYRYALCRDGLGRLVRADHSDEPSAGVSVGYDPNGNILTLTRGAATETFRYEGSNRLLGVTGPDGEVAAFEYRAGGAVARAGNPARTLTFRYDPVSGLAVSVTVDRARAADEGERVAFAYDGDGRRVLKRRLASASGDERSACLYLHGEADRPLLEVRRGAPGAARVVQYVYGPDGLVAAASAGRRYAVLKDHRGSVRLVLDEAGGLVAGFDYTPFGRLSGPAVGSDPSVMPYRFTGQELDEELGLYNYRSRFFDPDVGRFYAADPALQYFSPYVYVGNRPFDVVDPTGEIGLLAALAIAALVGAAFAGTANVVSQLARGGEFHAGEFGVAVGVGVVAGVATVGVGFAVGTAALAAGATASAGAEAAGVNAALNVTASSYALSGLSQGIAGALIGAVDRVARNALAGKDPGEGVLGASALGAVAGVASGVVGAWSTRHLSNLRLQYRARVARLAETNERMIEQGAWSSLRARGLAAARRMITVETKRATPRPFRWIAQLQSYKAYGDWWAAPYETLVERGIRRGRVGREIYQHIAESASRSNRKWNALAWTGASGSWNHWARSAQLGSRSED